MLGELAFEAHNIVDLTDTASVRQATFYIASAAIRNGQETSWGTINKLRLTAKDNNEQRELEQFMHDHGYNGEPINRPSNYKDLFLGPSHVVDGVNQLSDGTTMKPDDLHDIP